MAPPTAPESSRASPDNEPRVHLLVPTHTTRHLAPCIAGVAWQTALPASVVVSCDTDDAAVRAFVEATWARVSDAIRGRGQGLTPPPLLFVGRAFHGEARVNQVRNNALRAMESFGLLRDRDLVLAIDGDVILSPGAVASHLEMAKKGFELIIGYRLNLDPEATKRVALDLLLGEGGFDALQRLPTVEPASLLPARQRRYERQLFLRRLPIRLTKAHKPKVLGAHHALSVRALRAINGYDEEYSIYGFEDDDITRRVHAHRPHFATAIAVRTVPAFHLWHPSRGPAKPKQAPGYQRFLRRDLPVCTQRGWRNPIPQSEPRVIAIGETLPLGTREVRTDISLIGAGTPSAPAPSARP
jgi:Glycosyltransferase like family 2